MKKTKIGKEEKILQEWAQAKKVNQDILLKRAKKVCEKTIFKNPKIVKDKEGIHLDFKGPKHTFEYSNQFFDVINKISKYYPGKKTGYFQHKNGVWQYFWMHLK